TRLVLPAAHTATTGMPPGNSTSASALGSLALSASYASIWILPGTAHSAHSAVGRTSSTVTGRPSSSHVLNASTVIVFMMILLFLSRLAAQELASQEVLVRVDAPGSRWSVTS